MNKQVKASRRRMEGRNKRRPKQTPGTVMSLDLKTLEPVYRRNRAFRKMIHAKAGV